MMVSWAKMEAEFSSVTSVEEESRCDLDGVQPWWTLLPADLCFSRAVNLLVVFQYFHHVVVLKLQGVIDRQVAPSAQEGVTQGANRHTLVEGDDHGPYGPDTMNNMTHKVERYTSKMIADMQMLIHYLKAMHMTLHSHYHRKCTHLIAADRNSTLQ